MDCMGAQEGLFASIKVAYTNNRYGVLVQFWPPATKMRELTVPEARQSCKNHAVNVAGRCALLGVEIAMRIDPDDANVSMNTCNAADGAKSNTVIASQYQWELILLERCRNEIS